VSNGAAGSAGPSSYEAFYHFEPDIISTDLTVHKFNMPPYAKNLPLVISKYLALGMDLMAIFEKATVNPAASWAWKDRLAPWPISPSLKRGKSIISRGIIVTTSWSAVG
jgi:hypothetical protein